jgi:hypothetical protein
MVAGIAAALAVVPTACGSGQDSQANVIPKAQFLAKAQPICERGTAKMNRYYDSRVPQALKHADSEEFLNRVAQEIVIPVKRQEVKDLRALGLPAGSEKKLKAFLAAMEEGIELGTKDRRTLRSTGPYAFRRAFEMAGDVGLEACFIG